MDDVPSFEGEASSPAPGITSLSTSIAGNSAGSELPTDAATSSSLSVDTVGCPLHWWILSPVSANAFSLSLFDNIAPPSSFAAAFAPLCTAFAIASFDLSPSAESAVFAATEGLLALLAIGLCVIGSSCVGFETMFLAGANHCSRADLAQVLSSLSPKCLAAGLTPC